MPSVPSGALPTRWTETRQRLLDKGYEEEIFGSEATDLLLTSSRTSSVATAAPGLNLASA